MSIRQSFGRKLRLCVASGALMLSTACANMPAGMNINGGTDIAELIQTWANYNLQSPQTAEAVLKGSFAANASYIGCKALNKFDDRSCLIGSLAIGGLLLAASVRNDEIGQKLPPEDDKTREDALKKAPEAGSSKPIVYRTSRDETGTITQTRTYRNGKGHECATSNESITIDGAPITVVHNICVDENGKPYDDDAAAAT